MNRIEYFKVKRNNQILDKDYIPGITPPAGNSSIIIEKYTLKIKQNASYSYNGGKTGEEFNGKITGYGKKTKLIQRGDILESDNLKYKVVWVDGIGTKYTVLTLEEVK